MVTGADIVALADSATDGSRPATDTAARYPPLLGYIARMAHEFHRAAEMIDLGRARADAVLDDYFNRHEEPADER